MSQSSWHEELKQALYSQGLPASYTKRLLAELDDHYFCLTEENPNMEATTVAQRIGSTEELSNIAATQFKKRSFVGRHPVFTFLFAPIPSVVLCIASIAILSVCVGSFVPDTWTHADGSLTTLAVALSLLTWTLRVLPFALLTVAFSRVSHRTGCGWKWGLAASSLLATFAFVFAVDYTLPTSTPQSGSFYMGLRLPPGPTQMLQFGIVIGLAIVLANRHHRKTVAANHLSGELAC